jgi:hypothetical protein
MAKMTRDYACMNGATIDPFVTITQVVDNGDTTYDVSGIVRPAQPVQLQVFDINGNPLSGPLQGGGTVSWTITTPAINAPLPLCFVAQAGGATSTYVYPAVTVVVGPGLAKKKLAKKK